MTARLENGATGLFVVDDAALSRRRPVPLVDGSQGAEFVFDGVTADLLSADAVKVKPGMSVLFERWGGDGSLEGRVRTIEPFGFTKISALGVEEQRVNVIVDFISPAEDWQRLGDGYRVEARFVIWEDGDVLQVPDSSLFRLNDGWALFVVENGRARQRVVKIGQRTGLVAQILKGVEEGDKVVNHASDEVADGVRITER